MFRKSLKFSSLARCYSTKPKIKIALIPADGIGKEVVPAAVRVLDVLCKNIEFINLEAGWECFEKHGTSLPEETKKELVKCRGALFGAVSSPSHKVKGYSSPIVQMRTEFDLYANLRPIKSVPHVKNSLPNIDMIIVRENTEDLYIKKERLEDNGKRAIAEKLITEEASRKIADMAFQQAIKRSNIKSPLVTIVHKSNVLSVTDGLFRETCLNVAKKYPQVKVEEQLVDSMVYKMFLNPQYYNVVVAPNLYGDILSDAGAALVGGLGLVPSANVGEKLILVEPVHGSAPDIAGKGIANPIATIRAAGMLLEYLGDEVDLRGPKDLIERAIHKNLENGPRNPDLGGNGTTEQVTNDIIKHITSEL